VRADFLLERDLFVQAHVRGLRRPTRRMPLSWAGDASEKSV
jgi:hypothetical protein